MFVFYLYATQFQYCMIFIHLRVAFSLIQYFKLFNPYFSAEKGNKNYKVVRYFFLHLKNSE